MAFADKSTGHIRLYDDDDDEKRRTSSQQYCVYKGEEIGSLDDLPFYHGDMSRNASEVLLLNNATEGMYLLRSSTTNPGSHTVSVRCRDSVKHYTLECEERGGEVYVFGKGRFEGLQEVVDHFQCNPVLTSSDGSTITLTQPYARNVPEPNNYEDIATHSEQGKPFTSPEESFPDLHIASKEGFMMKRGAIRKNWKTRWFVLQKNYLKYYKKKESGSPIRTFDLRKATEVSQCDIDGKENCFKLVLPSRTFFMCSQSSYESEQWSKILKWKVDYYLNISANIANMKL